MANGDAAAAAGMDVVLGTADRRQGYDEINKTRDYIAALKTTVTTLKTRVDATGWLGNLPRMVAEPAGNPTTVPVRWANGRMSSLTPLGPLEVATKGYVDATTRAADVTALLELVQQLSARVAELEKRPRDE